MTEFNSGDGWREIDITRKDAPPADRLLLNEFGKPMRGWVREAPVPPLPTEPYTVIRVHFEGQGDNEFVRENGRWWGVGDNSWLDDENITGFVVLAEPRAVTAKAVLDDVRTIRDIARGYGRALDAIARDFGVES